MSPQREAFGWACIYGFAAGTACAAAQDAGEHGDRLVAGLLLGYGLGLLPIYLALQWRELFADG